MRLLLIPMLSGDQDHAAGCSATVDSCRTGIFQNLNRLHIAHIEVKAGFLRYSVHYIQRTHAAQVARAANQDLSPFSRSTASFRHAYTCRQTLQRLRNGLGGERLDILGAYRGDRTRHIGAFLSTVSYHDNVLQQLAILIQRHVIYGPNIGYRDRLSLISDIRDDDLLARLNV